MKEKKKTKPSQRNNKTKSNKYSATYPGYIRSVVRKPEKTVGTGPSLSVAVQLDWIKQYELCPEL